MGSGCGGNGNCCGNNDVGDSNINRIAAGAAIMMMMTAAAAAAAGSRCPALVGRSSNVDLLAKDKE
jgi:hypothetical protein